MTTPHVLIIGGGIAGISLAAHASVRARVTVVDMESTLTHHTTGRSAAMFAPNYGSLETRALTQSSRRFFESWADGYADEALLTERGTLTIARDDQISALRRLRADGVEHGADVRWVEGDEIRRLFPAVREGYAAAGAWEPDATDMDVAAIHQAFVRMTRANGGSIHTERPVRAIRRNASSWQVLTGSDPATADPIEADVVVNAAGAWGDDVAAMAEIQPVGLTPMRRTAFMVSAPADAAPWPMLIDADHDWYLKPDGSQLLCSPADETPSEPCDAQPEEVDVALAIERINAATDLAIRSVRSQWAGLRTFAPDRAPVTGFEPAAPGFFWLVGQGGTGIQTSPAAGRLAAGLILDGAPPPDIAEAGVDAAAFDPARFR